MSLSTLDTLLKSFRRQVTAIRIVRATVLLIFFAGLAATFVLPEPFGRHTMLIFTAAALVGWFFWLVSAVKLTREVQASSIYLATGQLDRAELWLRQVIEQFSLCLQAKMLACQHLAALCFRREAHHDVVAICRELLRYRPSKWRSTMINVRLLLADSLLMLDRVAEAYEAMRPVYDVPLSLADRMKLLPIQLRYELAADHAAAAVTDLSEKVQLAELLDSPRAALVHALLAEACRRQSLTKACDFLNRRARLYHDLDALAVRYAIIIPIAQQTPAAPSEPLSASE